MSHLSYSSYEAIGKMFANAYGYSQAVRVGDRIEASGQGGWDPETGEWPSNLAAEIAQAFANVDLNLKDAGGKGFEQVYRVNSYHTEMTEEVLGEMKKGFEKWMPNHKPIWTCVGVTQLAVPQMHVEIEVVAHTG